MTIATRLLVLFVLVPVSMLAATRASGYCAQGGQVVVTGAAHSANKVQQSYPSCTITVLYSGGPQGFVSTSGTTVTFLSGSLFNANSGWQGLTITIAGTPFVIASVASSTSLTLTTSAGTQTGVTYSMPASAPAPIFSDNAGTALANPFSSSSTGYWFFHANNANYDIKASGGGIPAPITWGNVPVIDPGTLPVYLSDTSIPFVYPALTNLCSAAATNHVPIVINYVQSVATGFTCNAPEIKFNGGMIQPASAQKITLTGIITAGAATIFDYSAGGTVDISKAKFSYGLSEWMGAHADGSAAGVNSGTAINNLLTAMGAGHSVMLGYGSGCYNTGSASIALGANQGILGPAPFSKACLQYTGNGDVISNSGTASYFTIKNFSILTTTAANGIHLNGAVGLNAVNVEISGVEFSALNTSVFSNAEILLEDTFLVAVRNNNMDAGAAYGVKLSSTFNNTDTVELNNISSTTQAGIYCNNSCTNMHFQDNVIESNFRKAIWIDRGNPVGILNIHGIHTENNSLGTADYDIYVSPGGGSFNGDWGPLTITENSLQNPNGLGAIYISNQQGVSVRENRCLGGTPTLKITLGPAVINPYVANNHGCALVGESGVAISDSSSILTYSNLFKTSVDLANNIVNAYWSIGGTGVSVDQSGAPLFDDGTPAWNLNLGSTTSPSPAGIGAHYTTTPTGRLFSCGVWAKANSGTATAYTSIADVFATYTGSLGTTQTVIDSTNWKWINTSVTTSSSDSGSFIGCTFTFYAISGATIVQLAKPEFCADTMNCGYVPTTTLPVIKASSPTGHTVFAQLPAATKSQPPIICDDCTVASPCAGSGTGALAVPIGTTNVCK